MVLSRLLRAGEGKILRRLKAISEAVNSIEDEVVALLDAERGWPTGARAYASCYGEAPLVVALQGRRTTVPCDGQTHPAGRAGPAERMRLAPRPQGLVAYRIALAPR